MDRAAYSPSEKYEFPPLLAGGFHVLTLEEIQKLCVKPFPISRTRDRIFQGLCSICQALRSVDIVGELWLDGGFLTSSINPKDCDIVFCTDSDFYESCSSPQRALLDSLDGDETTKEEYLCHAYLSVAYREGHKKWDTEKVQRARWTDWFGFSRRPKRVPKGIVKIVFRNDFGDEK